MYFGVRYAVDLVNADDALHGMLITGVGDMFVPGGDLGAASHDGWPGGAGGRVARFSGTASGTGTVVQGVTGHPNFREISPQPALQLPGVEGALRARMRRRVRASADLTAIAAGLTIACFVLGAWWWAATLYPLGIAGAVATLFGLVGMSQRFRSYRQARDILRAYTWQECRASIRPSARADADVELTDAGGNVVCRMTASRHDARGSNADAHADIVWFAGDLRFGGVIGQRCDVVGAEQLGQAWTLRVHRVPPGRDRASDQADRTAREAGLVPKDWRPA